MKSQLRQHEICVLPYPDGKAFAFTIIDDTDGSTLETVRPIYDYLFSLGLRTTKTVWVRCPIAPPQDHRDTGDTLETPGYAEYVRLLRDRGFEIALHNISSASSKRADTKAGLAAFAQILGELPTINIHHEKNLENMYFEFAQSGRHLPAPFRTAFFRRLHKVVCHGRRTLLSPDHGCSGENPHSDYFWGDLCKSTIKYVRTNVFFPDLNTLKCSPMMPYSLAETPLVNYWFDSSNGQDVLHFNSILSDRNIERLRTERGCSILYTHFGKGFVQRTEGNWELNAETRSRLQAVAGYAQGWYAPVTEILDRLLAFQKITVLPLPGGILIRNLNDFPIHSITLHTVPGRECCDLLGGRFTADRAGQLIIPVLASGAVIAILGCEAAEHATRWNGDTRSGLLADLTKVGRKLGDPISWQGRPHSFGTKA